MGSVKDIQQIKTLIAKGKKQGYLTFEELGKSLPSEISSPEQIEEVIGVFDQLNIAIVDNDEAGKKIAMAAEGGEEGGDGEISFDDSEESADYSSRSTDPVRMYLREMGSVPLLDREGEVHIAKKIESGEMDVLYALVEVPVAIEELANVGEDLKQGNVKLKDVVKTIEEDDPSEDEMNQRQRVIFLLEEVRGIYRKKGLKIYDKFDQCAQLERRVFGVQSEILRYKEDIVTRLRDIKLEKTLIDRIIETV
ncbi:MAG: RNA polymerase sigma factor region1.1 domain-containing protein, partial [Desulfovibrionaceae bacterium]